MEQSGDFSELESVISGDRSSISSFLAAPVSLNTHKIYEIANYGSSMAPFYSVLSIWIGGIVLVAMLKVNVVFPVPVFFAIAGRGNVEFCTVRE